LDTIPNHLTNAVDPSFYPTLQRYTRFAIASFGTFNVYQGACPNPPFQSKLVHTINNILTDTQVAVFQDAVAKEYIVSFPGSSSLQDFITDFAFIFKPFALPGCSDCQAHGGVLTAWKSVRDDLIGALSNLTSQNPDYRTIITGHSLGGGLASLCYTDLAANSIPVDKAYTMGSLRVGNPAYANFTDQLSGASDTSLGNFIRITHGIDGVPNLPSNAMGFRHTRTEIYEVDNASGQQSAETTYRCFGQEAADCNIAKAQGFINQDHLIYTGITTNDGKQCENMN
jgi:feruloyl esterase